MKDEAGLPLSMTAKMDKIPLSLAPRNDPLGFAQRALSNLSVIEKKFEQDGVEGRAHVVTQMVQSLLALLVFPQEKGLFKRLDELSAADVAWLPITELNGKKVKPSESLRRMRNAVCHNSVTFSGASTEGPDSRFVDEIWIEDVGKLREGHVIGVDMVCLVCF